MLDFNNGQPQRPHAGSFGATASDEARQASGGGRPPQPEAPRDYDKMPNLPALAELKNISQWVAWNYEWRKDRQDWVKMPKYPRTGGNAMTNNPATWGSYEEACQCARRHGFSGVGFVFTKETGFTGLDIDDAIGPDGEIADWAKPIVACAESYAEKSVSGTGIHTIIRGNVEKALANKKAGIEIYDTGRYFCFTGHHLKDSPVEILPAPETLRLARERVEEVKARETPEKATKREAPGGTDKAANGVANGDGHDFNNAKPKCSPSDSGNFYRRVNDTALQDLGIIGLWFTRIFPGARQSGSSWRASPKATGRSGHRVEDISVTTQGIKDFAEHDMGDPRDGSRTPIDLVLEWVPIESLPNLRLPNLPLRAAHWLCDAMGRDPAEFGWRDGTSSQAKAEAFSQAEARDVTKWSFLSNQQPTAPRMLVDDILPYRGIAFLGGQSGAGKTYVACDLALSLASRQPFFEHEVNERVGIAILSKEGTGNLANRLIAGAQARCLDLKDLPIAWRGDFPPIATPLDIQRVIEALASLSERIQAQYNVRCGAVIFDTVAASFAIDDENSNSEIAKISRQLRELEEKLDGLVIPIHHYGKSSTAGLRGGSLWKGTADVVLSTTCDKDETTGDTKNRQLSIAKARDGKEGPIAKFDLEFVELGNDDKGRPFGAMIVRPDFNAPTDGREKKKRPGGVNQQRFIDAFNEAMLAPRDFRVRGDGPTVKAVKLEYVRAEFFKRHVTGQTGLSEEDAGDIKRSKRRVDDANRKAWQRQLGNLPLGFYTETAPDGTEWIWRLPQ